MAIYLGLYYVPIEGGYYALPAYQITGVGDTVTMSSWEGSVYSTYFISEGRYNAGLVPLKCPGYYLRYDSSNNLGYRPFYGIPPSLSQTSPVWGGGSTSQGFWCTYLAFTSDQRVFIYYVRLDPTASSHQTYQVVLPVADTKPGYALVSWNEGYQHSHTFTASNEVTDPRMRAFLLGEVIPADAVDPYNPTGDDTSTEAGGGGTDPLDDEVGLEPVVFPSAVNTGFCRIYCPSASELRSLSDYLWGPLFDLSTVKRLFSDPMSSVLGLSVVPIAISGTSEVVSIAGVSTGISLPKLSGQHINVDLGSFQVTEKWGAYLDYEPYTKYSVYLPFIGYRTVSADDIMGKWVHLSYDIDLLSGACVAKLVSGSTLLYQWAGSCAMQLPVNAANWNSVISSGLAAIGSTATAIASGGAAAPVVAGALASAGTLATQMKPNIERAGGLSGAASFLAGRRAYMIRTMPELINPGDQPHYLGYPSFITKQLGSIAGYNVVEDIHLEGIPATQAELEEIDTLLHEGVIL